MLRLTLALAVALAVLAPTAHAQDDVRIAYAFVEGDDLQTAPGGRVQVEYGVAYRGPREEVEDVVIGFLLSRDGTLDAGDTLLETEETDVDRDETEDESEQVTLPDAAEPGCYSLLVVADYGDAIAEADESNNVRATVIAVGVPLTDCDVALADVVIRRPTVSARTLNPGATLTVEALLVNAGRATAHDVDASFFLSTDAVFDGFSEDTFVGFDFDGTLYAGGSVRVSATTRLPPATPQGDLYLLVVADAFRDVIESDEDNNVAVVRLRIEGPVVGGYPDLRVSDAQAGDGFVYPDWFDPELYGFEEGEVDLFFPVSFVVSNGGEAEAYDVRFDVTLSKDQTVSKDDVAIERETGNRRLTPGDDYTYFALVSVRPEPGEYFLIVTVSSRDADTDTGDNRVVAPVRVSGPVAAEPGGPGPLALSVPRPNPASVEVRLDVTQPAPGPVRVSVVDVLGRVVLARPAEVVDGAGTLTLDVSGLSPGRYVVVVEAGGTRVTRTLTVVR